MNETLPAVPKVPKPPSKKERQEERLTRILEKLLENKDVLTGLFGSATGLALLYPLKITVKTQGSPLTQYNQDGTRRGFYYPDARFNIETLLHSILPNIDIGSPIPGGGTIPIHIRDWFNGLSDLPSQPFVDWPAGFPGSPGNQAIADAAKPQLMGILMGLGLAIGPLLILIMRTFIGGADKGISKVTHWVNEVTPG